ncbi:3-oxoacyl-ACP synthase [Streptomyces cocklensis]|uniref:3-Oxoacyl-(Acyl-carrier-protein (ACP)) synthase n=1 Tax=Actinacidiphila cocklensis TaxID=887465 RepID=A0A9W4E0J7_9ACTN|nr:3-oxoacyl-[acyl-carrier-protein] synthase III C-terminal domain-containing protein [Actinacidiphila cocklensis]MDD1063729.1 3-oxoacyl-ACP synthase [Actinacidiphila cocklensis]WSX72924.1 3-oxoacyl-ACP synthase [Streptomyces sp. NBC_00899]WSX81008.1 3-oxoacyl-ACP synthase [Streptomyces sp. NBC_00899]CAG6391053.1 3-Oxoacyl-(Acyl-carrier-protein (ACP)) synthase [Actinacidiphila cocklensis]
MTTLNAVESFFPDTTVTVEERAAQLGRSDVKTHMHRTVHGLDRMHYDARLDLYDLVLPPARRILERVDPRSVRYLLYGHALHGARGAAPDTPQQIKHRLGIGHATAFAMTQQNCAIPLSAIDTAGALLRADGAAGATALLVTGEKPSPEVASAIDTVMIADGAAACLVSLDGPGAQVRSFATRTRGEYYQGLAGTREDFRSAAEMRPKVLWEIMREAVDRAGCTLDDIEWIIPPNQGYAFWEGVLDQEPAAGKVFFDNNRRFSHCLAADILINAATLLEEGRFSAGRPSMFIATGLGWTFSAMVVVPIPEVR